METLNLIEILKDCSKGTKLYSPIYGECTLAKVWQPGGCGYPIEVESTTIGGEDVVVSFTADGRAYIEHDGECVLWPSKDCRDWSQFVPPMPKPEPKPAPVFQPFDRVLVRDLDDCCWEIDFFDHYNQNDNFPYRVMNSGYRKYCIPYEGNEHLKDTINDPKED